MREKERDGGRESERVCVREREKERNAEKERETHQISRYVWIMDIDKSFQYTNVRTVGSKFHNKT